MTTLTRTLQEEMESHRENEWRTAGVSEKDIRFSRLCAIDARDVATFIDISRRGLLFVVRCPKLTARPWHGVLQPKKYAVKEKTGSSGVAVNQKGQLFVSDYDLMSIWHVAGGTARKIAASAANGAARGKYPPEGRNTIVQLNMRLISKIQHGCQDDFASPNNPGVKPSDHFAAFRLGVAEHFQTPEHCARYYERNHLFWPYNSFGKYIG